MSAAGSRLGAVLLASILGAGACARPESKPAPRPAAALSAEAGFVDVAPRDVALHGASARVGARARLFYNFVPARSAPESKPTLVLFNGFAAEIVRSFGTGPMTVADGGDVVPNASSLTGVANLLYVEPRQAGFSYDVAEGRAPSAADCSADVFNEYVDAADVLLGVLDVLDAHPRLAGPVVWVGESYGGVRVQWILSFLRGDWSVAPYGDATLEARVEELRAHGGVARLVRGQVLLEPWLLGKAHGDAIALECKDPSVIGALEASVGAPCALGDACSCAAGAGRSPYNFAFTIPTQARRVSEANLAHVVVSKIDALLGVPIERVAGLSAAQRGAGFKCDTPDDSVPAEDELTRALGPLPVGQAYFVPFSPLEPGKGGGPSPDWRALNLEAAAFIANLHDVPTFVTDGPLDLVVPTKALVPALRSVIDPTRVDASDPSRVRVSYPDGDRFIDVRRYPNAGHMITMLEAQRFASDVGAWLAR